MKKSTIWILTILMVLTTTGLLLVQIVYMRSMVKMRLDQFNESVRRSLYSVTSLLEQDETRHFLEEDIELIETNAFGTNTNSGVTYSITTQNGVSADLTIKTENNRNFEGNGVQSTEINHYRSVQDKLRGQYLYQRSLIDEVILNILSKSSDRPIYERADSSKVRQYLVDELSSNGIDLPFEFAITNNRGVVQYHTGNYSYFGDKKNGSVFVQTLFPGDPVAKRNYLRLYFPDRTNYIMSSVKFMIPSLIFTILLLITFVCVIIIAFRQKKLSEMKNDFINNMTHEFKTPISSISLAAQMLNDDSVRKSPLMTQHIATVINDETKRLRFQVEKVLQMSLFDRSRATLKLQEINANSAINSIIKTFNLKVERYGGKIEPRLNAANADIHVDEMHFTNVIFNLLDNAVKYRRENEPLELIVSTSDTNKGQLEIKIEDNGIGIKKEDLKKIFEKFYRVSTGNLHDVKGFGLGLAYVKKMISELGGEIKVESEYGVGTTFIILLPLIKNQ